MSSLSDEEDLLLLLASRSKRTRKSWVHDLNKKLLELREVHKLCKELDSYEDSFYVYFRMTRQQFEDLHVLVEQRISEQTTTFRRPIGTKERLAICLRYLATGDSHHTIAFSYHVGRSTVSKIVKDVCIELCNVLEPLYLPTPTEQVWRKCEVGFKERWDFPNCIGSIDGKHVKIKCANNSSSYFGDQQFFSIVLLAIVDHDCNFIVVDLGSVGRHSDSGIFEKSKFYRQSVLNKIILPAKPLPGTNKSIPHVFLGDRGFKLQTYLLRPFPKITTDEAKINFNKHLSRARCVVENAFGILTYKWRIFCKHIELKVDSAEHVVRAACCLHNFTKSNGQQSTGNEEEQEDTTHRPPNALSNFSPTREKSSRAAYAVRNHFVNYFNKE